jgi:predicted P-loop ATPase
MKRNIFRRPEPQNQTMQKNYSAYLARNTMAIQKNLNTELRIPVLKRACELLYRFDDYLREQSINKWVEEFNLSKRQLLGFLEGENAPKLSDADELREILLTYDIRENEITGEILIKKNKKPYTMDELRLNLENEGLKLNHFDKFLNSSNKNITVTKVYNPLKDFYTELAHNYKGEKLISELADCIPAIDFGDKEKGDYQKRLEYYFRKWLYKSAGQALNIGVNDAMLLWIEPIGGSGKSYINQWLFSLPEFDNYYIRIGSNGSYLPMARLSSGKFVLDFDELPLSHKRYQEFKSTIAATKGQDYTAKSGKYESYTRKVNFIGSTNKANRERQKGFLLDDDDAMKRRIIPVDLFGRINYQKYTKDIDLYQLWGEAAAGILQAEKSNSKNLLTWECDWADLRQQNARYVNSNDANDKNVILSNFKPGEVDKGILLSATDILSILKTKGIKTDLSKEKAGSFLARHNFIHGIKGRKRGWWIKE